MKFLLWPLAFLYASVLHLRNWLYNANVFRSYAVEKQVISVGNLNVGGTGKTPFVEQLTREMLSRGMQLAVISRGYKRQSSGQVVVSEGDGPLVSVADAGDEPYMLSYLIPEAIIIVNNNRVQAARDAVSRYQADVVIMDDGFQHRKLKRDEDLVIIPLQDILEKEMILPAGRLRESWTALRRATKIVVTGSKKEMSDTNTEEIHKFIRKYSAAPVITAIRGNPAEIINPVVSEMIDISSKSDFKVFGLAGIGRPEQFKVALQEIGCNVVGFFSYKDHFSYPLKEQKKIIEDFEASDADCIVMTAKDFVKWDKKIISEYPIYYLPFQYEFHGSLMDL